MHGFRDGIKDINLEDLKQINKNIIRKAKENKIYRKGTIDRLVVVGIDGTESFGSYKKNWTNSFKCKIKNQKYINGKKEVIEEEKVELEVTEEVIVEQEEPEAVLETLIGSMSGYGPDCIGCTSNKTASGYYVGEGNIYYQDPTYGKVRILAGDSKYPFYTIVRINDANLSDEPILGIVLDRGSAIGIGKKYMFDLLYASEKDAATLGVSSNVTFEILRIGK